MNLDTNKKCIIYCRVSSKEQEDRGYSLEAQEKLLTEYAVRNELNAVKIFKISESASGKQIRKTFNEMLVYVKQKRINIILCEKIDRLTRNLKDGAVISDWVTTDENRQVHFVKENFVVSKNTRAHENLVWDMKVAIARFYTNNLSEEVKKGQIAKLESGWIPNGQKYGYKTVGEKGHKIHVPDEKFAPFIKRAFEFYSSGNYTVTRLTETMQKEGMTSKCNKPIGRSIIHTMLSDPFYYGVITWNKDEYEGKHEPIITRELFNEVQNQMKRIYKNGQMKIHNHAFKGLIKCGGCGCVITWETQKGHHYGHCKGFKPCHEKGYIRQEEIEAELMSSFEKIKPRSDKVLNWIKKALKEAHNNKKGYSNSARENLSKSLELIENRMDKIYDDKIDEVITVEYYKKRFKEYSTQKQDILGQLNKMENNIQHYYEVGVEIHDLAYKAKELYLSTKSTTDDKRTLINKIFADLKLKDKKLIAEYTPAYKFLSEWMPKLNATSELLKQGEYYEKTGAFAPAHPCLLPGQDSNL
ncbi:MAG: recombinase family protein [Ignavibacteriaceae bacterium]